MTRFKKLQAAASAPPSAAPQTIDVFSRLEHDEQSSLHGLYLIEAALWTLARALERPLDKPGEGQDVFHLHLFVRQVRAQLNTAIGRMEDELREVSVA